MSLPEILPEIFPEFARNSARNLARNVDRNASRSDCPILPEMCPIVQTAIGVLENFGPSISGNNSVSNSGNDPDGRSQQFGDISGNNLGKLKAAPPGWLAIVLSAGCRARPNPWALDLLVSRGFVSLGCFSSGAPTPSGAWQQI